MTNPNNAPPARLDPDLLKPDRLRVLSMIPTRQWRRVADISDTIAEMTHEACYRRVTWLLRSGYVRTQVRGSLGLFVTLTPLGRRRLAGHTSALLAIVVDAGTHPTRSPDDVLPPDVLQRPAVASSAVPFHHVPGRGGRPALTAGELEKFMGCVGEELRAARIATRYSLAVVRDNLATDAESRTLATYEVGLRRIPLARLIEICAVLGVAPGELIDRAVRRSFGEDAPGPAPLDDPIPNPTVDTAGGEVLRVNVRALATTTQAGLQPVRGWAAAILATPPARTVVQLTGPALALLADLCGMDTPALVDALRAL